MSEQFLVDAKNSVQKAIEKAEDLGLPKAYVETAELPTASVIEKISSPTNLKSFLNDQGFSQHLI
jgi:replication initiation and membrane attachment protein DnaB